ncbi:MAG: exodeoxyribonuclease III [Candidatus Omnitrophota bacterium]
MKILSWNVNGIRAISRKGFLEWFKKESPEILCLQETKAHPSQLGSELTAVEGYRSFWNNPEKKGYAGVSVYTREKAVLAPLDISGRPFDYEGRIITLEVEDIILINVYFPNGGRSPDRLKYKLDFYEKFLKYADKLKNRNIVICGDVNTAHREIDLARPKQNEKVSGFLPEERAWIDKLISHGYVDVFRHFNDSPGQYTWWDYKTRSREKNVGWRIDYFFVTGEILPRVRKAYILPEVEGSDHCPIGIELK